MTQCQEIQQSMEPYSEISCMLVDAIRKGHKITMINMLKDLLEKVDTMYNRDFQ